VKLIATALALVLLVGFVAPAADLGLYQNFNGTTSFRFDAKSIYVQPALDFTFTKIGYKRNLVEDVYLKAGIKFVTSEEEDDMNLPYESLGIGLGYTVQDSGQKFRVEGTARNPVNAKEEDWSFDVGIGWQFALSIGEVE